MTRMTTLSGAVLLSAALATLTGCVETAGTTVTTDHLTGSSLVMEDSTRLRDQIQILKVNYDEVNGLKRVHITLQSTKHRRLRLNYRIAWFDANGMEVDPSAKTYRNLILEGRDTVTVTGLANSPACVTSKLRVRDLEAAD
ncbi:MAG TPA: YcfL family protein [Kiritimatiellia bacterium]|nr:YcfL family protein [Kiritimatiellia bacterium]HRR35051.1 YcfL family protein [Kiritimatiellia bacterium]HRU71671.1 YcfL family protein [Kiritimatiellia bacterium]